MRWKHTHALALGLDQCLVSMSTFSTQITHVYSLVLMVLYSIWDFGTLDERIPHRNKCIHEFKQSQRERTKNTFSIRQYDFSFSFIFLRFYCVAVNTHLIPWTGCISLKTFFFLEFRIHIERCMIVCLGSRQWRTSEDTTPSIYLV